MLYVGSGVLGSVMNQSSILGKQIAGQLSTSPQTKTLPGGVKKAEARARRKLEELQLSSSVRLASTSASTIRVFGSISPKHASTWNQFLRWYDEQSAYPKLIRDVVRTGKNPKIPKLQSVWLTERPTAYFASGVSASVGDELSGNWKVTKIDREAVTIERDGSPVRLRF